VLSKPSADSFAVGRRQKVFGFLGGAIYRDPGSHLQERTLRVIE
jgi:hypothetical protein